LTDIADGAASLISDTRDLELRMRWDATVFGNIWLWCANRKDMRCIAIEPSTTCPAELLNNPDDAPFLLLRPDETVRGWVELEFA
jgi:hypothetical protein